jgi:lipopolysaccharide biosynthesis protein
MNRRFSIIAFIRLFFYRAFKKIGELITRRKKTKIYITQEFSEFQNKKICIFAHFDSKQIIRDYVLLHLETLKNTGFEIILVSTSGIKKEEYVKLEKLISTYIHKENLGYDFGSWIAGYNYLKNKFIPSELILTNDSVYGPFSDLNKIFTEMEKRKLDFWGLTDSYEVKYHIQSYFLWISGNVLQSEIWKKWVNSFYYYNSAFKTSIVHKYEIGISRLIMQRGFKVGVYIDYFDLLKNVPEQEFFNRGIESTFKNPTLNLWDILILEKGFPYLKRNLINSQRISSYQRNTWIQKLNKYKKLISIIRKDLKDF